MGRRRRVAAAITAIGLTAGLVAVPTASPRPAEAAVITCANGTSPLSLTYDTTGLTTPSITLPLTQIGTGGVVVDWGDGTTSTYTTGGNQSHTFPAAGPYTVQICGALQTFGSTAAAVANVATLKTVNSFGTLGTLGSLAGAFRGATRLTSVPATLPASVTKTPQMFMGATTFNDSNVTSWDTSRITDMSNMFDGATAFNQNLNTWSTAAVLSMYGMFANATVFNNGCAAGQFTCAFTWTTPVLTNVSRLFASATAFNQNVNSFTSAGFYGLKETFSISGFNNGCAANDTSCPLTWRTPLATDMSSTFYLATIFNQNVTRLFDVPNQARFFPGMFREASLFNNGDNDPAINTWNTSRVSQFNQMFYMAPRFNRAVQGWNMSSATDLSTMFQQAAAFNNGCARGDTTCPLSWTGTGLVTTINAMFAYQMGNGSSVMSFDQSLNSWDITSIRDYNYAFSRSAFNNGGEPLWSGKTVKTGATMFMTFETNTKFNVPVGGLNVSGVANMGMTFSGSTKFDQDISAWRVSGLTTTAIGYPPKHSMQTFMNGNSFNGGLSGLSVTNYEKFLNSLGTVTGGVLTLTYLPNTWTTTWAMDMGTSKYTCNTQELRTKLGQKFTITDSGMAPLPAPLINGVTNGDGYVDVAYSAPVCLGTPTSPSSYQYSKDNGATWTTFAAPTPDASADGTLRINNLQNNVTYPLRIRAVTSTNQFGASSDRADGTPVGPTIVEPVVTISTKPYDGTTRASITQCALRVKDSNPAQYVTDATIASCDVSAATATFSAASAGLKLVSTTGASLTGPRATEYRLAASPDTTAIITQAPLNVVPDPVTVSPGTDPAAVTYPFTVNGWANGEGPTTTFTPTAYVPPRCSAALYDATKTPADSPLTITCTGGTAPGNYRLFRTATAALTIQTGPPPTPVVATITANDKVYNGTRTATITCSLDGVLAADAANVSCDVSGATALFDTKDVGDGKTVTATGLALVNTSSTNYQLSATTRTALASITPKDVTPSITVRNKRYDTSTAATITGCTLTGVVTAVDATVGCDYSGAVATFDDADAGTGKTVTGTGLTVTNNGAGNYKATSDSATGQADITPVPLTLKAQPDEKVYDGGVSSDVLPLSGLLGGETTNATQSFDSADAGTGKTLTLDLGCSSVASITIHQGAADVTANYAISCNGTAADGTITPAPVTIAPASDTKSYDKTKSSTGVPLITGLIGNDAIDASQEFDNAAAGGRNLVITDWEFTSGRSDNYTVADSGTAGGAIDAIGPVKVKAPDVQYAFDGSTPTLTPTTTGFLSGDTFMTDPVCKVYATTDLTYASAITNFVNLTPGTYTVHCRGGDPGGNYTDVEYVDGVLQPQGTATFTGVNNYFTRTDKASVTLSATVDPGTDGCYALFRLFDSSDTERYTFGPFHASSGAVATSQIVDVGQYTVQVTAFGNCYGRTAGDDTLSVMHDSVGRGSVGGGFYRNGAAPSKLNFGYEIQVSSSTRGSTTTTTTKGQLLWIAKVGWRVKGSVNYSSTDGSTKWSRISCPSMPSVWPAITRPMCGEFHGTGKLQRMNPSTLQWETYDANIRFTATTYDGGQVTTCRTKITCTTTQYPDFYGMTIWASDGSQILPGSVSPAIPTSTPIQLTNGQTRVFTG